MDEHKSRARSEPRHLFEAGQRRERLNVARWLDARGYEYLRHALGFPRAPLWIGLSLSRANVLGGEYADGDVDLIMGTMRWDMTYDEWDASLESQKRSSAPGTHPSWFEVYVAVQASAEGRLVWCDRMDRLDAVEAKSGWFDAAANKWKHTHLSSGKQTKIGGQLRVLHDAGFDRVALLHLAATAPRETEFHPWWQASDDALAGASTFPHIMPRDAPKGCGYFRAITGAIPGKTEDFAGTGGALETLVPALTNLRADSSRNWRASLHGQLQALGIPRFPPPVYVLECPVCKQWFLAQRPTQDGSVCSAACVRT